MNLTKKKEKKYIYEFLCPILEKVLSFTFLIFGADKKTEYYKKLREDLKKVDKEDKDLDRQRRREKRMKDKLKQKRGNLEEEEDDDLSDSEGEPCKDRPHKRSKIYFDSDDEGEREESKDKLGFKPYSVSLAEQEALALKLLSSMHA